MEYGFGRIIIRSPYSIYLRRTIDLAVADSLLNSPQDVRTSKLRSTCISGVPLLMVKTRHVEHHIGVLRQRYLGRFPKTTCTISGVVISI